MAFRSILTSASALAILASPALADLTAAEVWAEWQEMLSLYGAEVSTGAVDDGSGRVAIQGLTIGMAMPEGGAMTVDMGDLVFTETGDGSVRVEMAERIPMTMDIPSPEGEGSLAMTMTQTGLDVLVSGDTRNLTYDFTADAVGISEVVIDDPASAEEFDFDVDVTTTAIEGTYKLTGSDLREFDADITAAGLTGLINGSGLDENDQPAEVSIRFELSDLTEELSGSFRNMNMAEPLPVLIRDGLAYAGNLAYGAAAYEMSGSGPDGPFSITGTAENGKLNVSLSESGLSYATSNGPQTVSMTGGQVPFPLGFSIAATSGNLAFPVLPSEDIQDFVLSMAMEGLTLDDTIWNIFDPAGQVPRDPATVVLDLSGEVILEEDIFDPAYAENPEAAAPGSIESLAINDIRIELAGASLTGDGDFSFIQTPMMPQPVGRVDLMLVGGNALIDLGVNMGLLPQEQAMGARMMLGLFARPGEGEDTLISTIEVKEDGSVLANGQRIK